MTKPLTGDEIFRLSMEKVVVPFTYKVAELVRDAVKDEILDQGLIDTGRFFNSIVYEVDDDTLTIQVKSELEDFVGMYYYPAALEFGTSKMQPKAPFRKSIARVQKTLDKVAFMTKVSEGGPEEFSIDAKVK